MDGEREWTITFVEDGYTDEGGEYLVCVNAPSFHVAKDRAYRWLTQDPDPVEAAALTVALDLSFPAAPLEIADTWMDLRGRDWGDGHG